MFNGELIRYLNLFQGILETFIGLGFSIGPYVSFYLKHFLFFFIPSALFYRLV